MSDKQDIVDRLMQSLSSIDDDLLLDVEPAKRRNVISMPHDRVDESSEDQRSCDSPRVSPDRSRMRERNGRKRMPNRKAWISVASIAACLVIVLGSLYVWNPARKVLAPMDAEIQDPMNDWESKYPDNMYWEDPFGKVASLDGNFLDNAAFDRVTETIDGQSVIPPLSERGYDLSREVMRTADQTAFQMLAKTKTNALYSPFNIYQTVAFLAASADENRLFGDVVDSRSDELASISFPYHFSKGTFFAQNGVLMSTHLYEKCDLTLLNSACKSFYFDAYVWNGDRGTSNDDTVDSSPITIPYSTRAIHWNPLDELLILFRYQAEVAWTGNVSSVDLNQGLFHASRRTFTDVPYYDADDASLRHFTLDGAVACELLVQGGSLYLVLPNEGSTPEDLLKQDRFFTRLLTAEPAGENAVARFPELNIRDRRNLVDPAGIQELRALAETSVRLRWLKGVDVTFPLLGQDIDFSLDGPVRETDEPGPDAVGRMSLEAVFDRPFIFCLTEGTYNTPILVGIYRYPE